MPQNTNEYGPGNQAQPKKISGRPKKKMGDPMANALMGAPNPMGDMGGMMGSPAANPMGAAANPMGGMMGSPAANPMGDMGGMTGMNAAPQQMSSPSTGFGDKQMGQMLEIDGKQASGFQGKQNPGVQTGTSSVGGGISGMRSMGAQPTSPVLKPWEQPFVSSKDTPEPMGSSFPSYQKQTQPSSETFVDPDRGFINRPAQEGDIQPGMDYSQNSGYVAGQTDVTTPDSWTPPQFETDGDGRPMVLPSGNQGRPNNWYGQNPPELYPRPEGGGTVPVGNGEPQILSANAGNQGPEGNIMLDPHGPPQGAKGEGPSGNNQIASDYSNFMQSQMPLQPNDRLGGGHSYNDMLGQTSDAWDITKDIAENAGKGLGRDALSNALYGRGGPQSDFPEGSLAGPNSSISQEGVPSDSDYQSWYENEGPGSVLGRTAGGLVAGDENPWDGDMGDPTGPPVKKPPTGGDGDERWWLTTPGGSQPHSLGAPGQFMPQVWTDKNGDKIPGGTHPDEVKRLIAEGGTRHGWNMVANKGWVWGPEPASEDKPGTGPPISRPPVGEDEPVVSGSDGSQAAPNMKKKDGTRYGDDNPERWLSQGYTKDPETGEWTHPSDKESTNPAISKPPTDMDSRREYWARKGVVIQDQTDQELEVARRKEEHRKWLYDNNKSDVNRVPDERSQWRKGDLSKEQIGWAASNGKYYGGVSYPLNADADKMQQGDKEAWTHKMDKMKELLKSNGNRPEDFRPTNYIPNQLEEKAGKSWIDRPEYKTKYDSVKKEQEEWDSAYKKIWGFDPTSGGQTYGSGGKSSKKSGSSEDILAQGREEIEKYGSVDEQMEKGRQAWREGKSWDDLPLSEGIKQRLNAEKQAYLDKSGATQREKNSEYRKDNNKGSDYISALDRNNPDTSQLVNEVMTVPTASKGSQDKSNSVFQREDRYKFQAGDIENGEGGLEGHVSRRTEDLVLYGFSLGKGDITELQELLDRTEAYADPNNKHRSSDDNRRVTGVASLGEVGMHGKLKSHLQSMIHEAMADEGLSVGKEGKGDPYAYAINGSREDYLKKYAELTGGRKSYATDDVGTAEWLKGHDAKKQEIDRVNGIFRMEDGKDKESAIQSALGNPNIPGSLKDKISRYQDINQKVNFALSIPDAGLRGKVLKTFLNGPGGGAAVGDDGEVIPGVQKKVYGVGFQGTDQANLTDALRDKIGDALSQGGNYNHTGSSDWSRQTGGMTDKRNSEFGEYGKLMSSQNEIHRENLTAKSKMDRINSILGRGPKLFASVQQDPALIMALTNNKSVLGRTDVAAINNRINAKFDIKKNTKQSTLDAMKKFKEEYYHLKELDPEVAERFMSGGSEDFMGLVNGLREKWEPRLSSSKEKLTEAKGLTKQHIESMIKSYPDSYRDMQEGVDPNRAVSYQKAKNETQSEYKKRVAKLKGEAFSEVGKAATEEPVAKPEEGAFSEVGEAAYEKDEDRPVEGQPKDKFSRDSVAPVEGQRRKDTMSEEELDNMYPARKFGKAKPLSTSATGGKFGAEVDKLFEGQPVEKWKEIIEGLGMGETGAQGKAALMNALFNQKHAEALRGEADPKWANYEKKISGSGTDYQRWQPSGDSSENRGRYRGPATDRSTTPTGHPIYNMSGSQAIRGKSDQHFLEVDENGEETGRFMYTNSGISGWLDDSWYRNSPSPNAQQRQGQVPTISKPDVSRPRQQHQDDLRSVSRPPQNAFEQDDLGRWKATPRGIQQSGEDRNAMIEKMAAEGYSYNEKTKKFEQSDIAPTVSRPPVDVDDTPDPVLKPWEQPFVSSKDTPEPADKKPPHKTGEFPQVGNMDSDLVEKYYNEQGKMPVPFDDTPGGPQASSPVKPKFEPSWEGWGSVGPDRKEEYHKQYGKARIDKYVKENNGNSPPFDEWDKEGQDKPALEEFKDKVDAGEVSDMEAPDLGPDGLPWDLPRLQKEEQEADLGPPDKREGFNSDDWEQNLSGSGTSWYNKKTGEEYNQSSNPYLDEQRKVPVPNADRLRPPSKARHGMKEVGEKIMYPGSRSETTLKIFEDENGKQWSWDAGWSGDMANEGGLQPYTPDPEDKFSEVGDAAYGDENWRDEPEIGLPWEPAYNPTDEEKKMMEEQRPAREKAYRERVDAYEQKQREMLGSDSPEDLNNPANWDTTNGEYVYRGAEFGAANTNPPADTEDWAKTRAAAASKTKGGTTGNWGGSFAGTPPEGDIIGRSNKEKRKRKKIAKRERDDYDIAPDLEGVPLDVMQDRDGNIDYGGNMIVSNAGGLTKADMRRRGVKPSQIQALVNNQVAQNWGEYNQAAGGTGLQAQQGMNIDEGTRSQRAISPLVQSLLGSRKAQIDIPWQYAMQHAGQVRDRRELAHQLGLQEAGMIGQDFYADADDRLAREAVDRQLMNSMYNTNASSWNA